MKIKIIYKTAVLMATLSHLSQASASSTFSDEAVSQVEAFLKDVRTGNPTKLWEALTPEARSCLCLDENRFRVPAVKRGMIGPMCDAWAKSQGPSTRTAGDVRAYFRDSGVDLEAKKAALRSSAAAPTGARFSTAGDVEGYFRAAGVDVGAKRAEIETSAERIAYERERALSVERHRLEEEAATAARGLAEERARVAREREDLERRVALEEEKRREDEARRLADLKELQERERLDREAKAAEEHAALVLAEQRRKDEEAAAAARGLAEERERVARDREEAKAREVMTLAAQAAEATRLERELAEAEERARRLKVSEEVRARITMRMHTARLELEKAQDTLRGAQRDEAEVAETSTFVRETLADYRGRRITLDPEMVHELETSIEHALRKAKESQANAQLQIESTQGALASLARELAGLDAATAEGGARGGAGF